MPHEYAGQPIALVGVPTDANSSFMRGAAGAPAAIRQALQSPSANAWTENGVDLGAAGVLFDAGDIDAGEDGNDFNTVRARVAGLVERGAHVIAMGGDHAVTHPLVQAHRQRWPRLSLLHFDAHPDLYDDFDGNPRSHASPFARIMEEGWISRLVQVGIRTATDHQREQARRFGVELIEMKDWEDGVRDLAFEEPIYLSFDVDVLDPAFAPGVSHWEPGGASTRQAIDAIHALDATVIGADVVELNPERDMHGITAMTAARVLRE
ncbi:MAG: agmatinase, partial [Planctomycetota bacterium]